MQFKLELYYMNIETRYPNPNRPELLDIVKIDDRWAQVVGGGDQVRFLQDGQLVDVNWDDYSFEQNTNRTSLGNLVAFGNATISEAEIDNIHWQAEKTSIELKKNVAVFGFFKKK